MVILPDLWIPVLLSAVIVFIASSIIHMVLPIHRGDYKKLSGEAEVLKEMRAQKVQPGEYAFPCPSSMKEVGSPEMIEKYNEGPVGFVTVLRNGPPALGKNLVQWFLYSVFIGIFVGYIARLGLDRGAEYMDVFRMTSTVAIFGYSFSYVPQSIWRGYSWSSTLKYAFDGVVYGLLTAGTFAWLWPDIS
jgi:hypothetical protein